MRIIAGVHRGRAIQAPKGTGTRPTVDRVRESLMSAINSARGGFEGASVLDAFAGSGALGLEALSRGAVSAVFCERDGNAFRTLCANCRSLGYDTRGDRALAGRRSMGGVAAGADSAEGASDTAEHADRVVRVRRADVLKNPPAPAGKPFDIVFLDPPYALVPDEVFSLLDALVAAAALEKGTLATYEHAASANGAVDAAIAARAPSFALDSRRAYGDTVMDVLTIG